MRRALLGQNEPRPSGRARRKGSGQWPGRRHVTWRRQEWEAGRSKTSPLSWRFLPCQSAHCLGCHDTPAASTSAARVDGRRWIPDKGCREGQEEGWRECLPPTVVIGGEESGDKRGTSGKDKRPGFFEAPEFWGSGERRVDAFPLVAGVPPSSDFWRPMGLQVRHGGRGSLSVSCLASCPTHPPTIAWGLPVGTCGAWVQRSSLFALCPNPQSPAGNLLVDLA